MLENMLMVRFGAVDEELASAINSWLQLPPQEAISLVWRSTREELLQRLDCSWIISLVPTETVGMPLLRLWLLLGIGA